MRTIIIDDDAIQGELIKAFAEKMEQVDLIEVFTNPLHALESLQNERIDLVILDVEMPEMNGFEVINQLTVPPLVIVTSSHPDHAAEAFDFEAVDFLTKPVDFSRFSKSIYNAQKKFNEARQHQHARSFLFAREGNVIVRINFDDILCIEAERDYLNLHCTDGDHRILLTMQRLMAQLPDSDFIRVHRSHIVRMDKISKIEGDIIAIQQHLIPISKSYKNTFLEQIRPV